MALTLATLQATVAKLSTDVQALIAQGSGNPGITQADIDAVTSAVQTVDDAVTAATNPPAPVPPAPAPAPAPVPPAPAPAPAPSVTDPGVVQDMIMPGLPHTAAKLSGGQ